MRFSQLVFSENNPPGPLTKQAETVLRTLRFCKDVCFAKFEILALGSPKISIVTHFAIGYINIPKYLISAYCSIKVCENP